MKNKIIQIGLLSVLCSIGLTNFSYAQDAQISGGVDVDGTWYLGEGLEIGNYFEYSLCEKSLNECSPIELKMWIKGEVQNVSETLWDAKVVIIDGEKIAKGSWGLGKITPEPLVYDEDLFDYVIAIKSSLNWLSAFATANEDDRLHGPQEFSSGKWGNIGNFGSGSDAPLIPHRIETIDSALGTVDAMVVGWYVETDNEMWIVDDFPFPVKALTYPRTSLENPPIQYQFNLLKYKENVVDDPFKDVRETILKEELLECPTKFYDYVSQRSATDTYSMMIQYNYSPEYPTEGCNIDWKINFISKYNEVEILDKIHYDVWVVDEQGKQLRSFAQEMGEEKLFAELGRVQHLVPIKEEAGTVHYSIVVHGTGPEQDEPDASMSGSTIVKIQIDENPLLEKLNDDSIPSHEIPSWIKNNAGWWSEDQIDDETFVSGIQFLIKEGILDVSKSSGTSQDKSSEIPSWIKNNAEFWFQGLISDDDFLSGIQYLVNHGIIVAS